MRRRDFIAGLGGAAAWPMMVRAQQGDRVRRIGVLNAAEENDPEAKARISAFTQALAGLGWTVGRNVRMDLRWAGAATNRARALAQELVGLQPDIIVTTGTPATAAVLRETRMIPIVFKRPRRQRPRLGAQPARREYYRLRVFGSFAGRQVAWAALGDRARA